MRHYSPQPAQPLQTATVYINGARSKIIITCAAIILLGWSREAYIGTSGDLAMFDTRHIALFDSQFSIGTWFASSLLLAASALSFLIAAADRREVSADRYRWVALGILFAGLSLDKSVNAHQLLLEPLSSRIGVVAALWFPLIPTLCVATYLSPMLWRMPPQYAARFFLCALTLIAGAIVMDAISSTLAMTYGARSFAYVSMALFEESLELIGITALVITLLNYFAESWPRWIVEARREKRPASSRRAAHEDTTHPAGRTISHH